MQSNNGGKIKFQYIKCDGSALFKDVIVDMKKKFQYIKCDGSANAITDLINLFYFINALTASLS